MVPAMSTSPSCSAVPLCAVLQQYKKEEVWSRLNQLRYRSDPRIFYFPQSYLGGKQHLKLFDMDTFFNGQAVVYFEVLPLLYKAYLKFNFVPLIMVYPVLRLGLVVSC